MSHTSKLNINGHCIDFVSLHIHICITTIITALHPLSLHLLPIPPVCLSSSHSSPFRPPPQKKMPHALPATKFLPYSIPSYLVALLTSPLSSYVVAAFTTSLAPSSSPLPCVAPSACHNSRAYSVGRQVCIHLLLHICVLGVLWPLFFA